MIPAARAAIAHRRGAHRKVANALLPARRSWWQMGGSHAQRDLFFQLLVDAAMRENRRDLLQLLLGEIDAVGFEHLAERSSYADAAALAH